MKIRYISSGHTTCKISRRSERTLSVLLSAVLCITLLVQPGFVKAESPVRTVNNIVLFAQFSHEDGYNFMSAERTKLTVDGCTRTDTVNSLHGYIDAISYGNMRTECYFPQLDGDTVQPYILSQPLESYSRSSLALEIVRNVRIPEDIPLDGDNDGYIDNFILIIDGEAVSQSDTLWQHMSSLAYAGMSINGKKVDACNILNSGSLFGSVVNPFNTGVLCHEFLHSIGYPDLYRSSSNSGTPVGAMWDIMSGTLSRNLVSPLAYMRASRSGWLDTADITEDGTYTLSPASSDSGNRVYLLKTPASESEFFAVEFRKQGDTFQDIDGICNTGLLVYRVNTLVNGNRDSDMDEIYLFRPGNGDQTGQANYGGAGRDDHVGSPDPDDGIEDGAITYSNGVNSGICIENITVSGDKLTFDVKFTETDRQSGWHTVPNSAELSSTDIAASDSGILYLAGVRANGRAAGLYRLSETSCEHVSDLTASGNIYEAQLAVAGETPYLLYKDADFRAVLCSYDPTDGKWRTLWKSEGLAQYTDIAAKGDAIYVCYTEGDYPSYTMRAFCYSGGDISDVGGVISKSGCFQSIVCTDETVAVAYRDLADGNLPKLALLKENSWTQVSLSSEPCNMVNAATDGKTITVAVTGKSAGLYCYKDGALSFTEYPELPGDPLYVYPLYVGGELTAAVYTQKDFNYSLYRCGSEWEMLGSCIEAQAVVEPRIAASGNTIYTSYLLGTGFSGENTVYIKALQYGRSVPGDVNADGKLTVADLVLLQKWLLAVPDTRLANWKAADLYEDNRLDTFDLCLMRRALLG